ncbi:adhesion G-protein coupled receptor G1 isoform X1 [Micropterus salmoides]|uniref:adhesion G-protein coupled receptor G1 isoform X1 n=1 Tax=Micropterus salmoides TaxID=27706 RepID=UPI0018EC31F8|nr:adhesion G-protein coupled receptor G1 isoform X1 [Micropterus salmoides]XP_038557644.1 adhesion G-protein coupled receptor G1 isoform X1 [Micropterus salmoides]
MEPRLTDNLNVVFILITLLCTGSSENDLYLNFCGTWLHGDGSLSLNVDLSTGCNGISVSANRSSLSINGQITAQCKRSEVISLEKFGLDSEEKSHFCLYWEPLLDQLKLEIRGNNLTLCWPASLQGSCCTDLSHGANTPEAPYGITNGMIKNDVITDKVLTAYTFNGSSTDCKALCDQANQGPTQVNMSKDTARSHPCAHSTEVDMKENFRGYNVKSPAPERVSAESTINVHIPPALKQAAKKTSKVLCTFFKNNSLFQEGHKESRVLDDVVGITVENEVITNLSAPVKIDFHHDVIPKTHPRKCVSWDTRKDPLQVRWLVDGCKTKPKGEKHTECLCNHLTYFTVLVQVEPRPVRHLLALTAITFVGCAVSFFSCLALIVYLCRKSRRSKEQSIPIHLGLAVSLAFLYLLFFFTGVLANMGGESVCPWVGAGLHYSLLSSFTWMGIEVFHTFWLVCMVFSPSPKPYVWNPVGFVLPAVPVVILAAVGDIYGVREVESSDDMSSPYLMCWMKNTKKALLAHYFTSVTALVILVSSGVVMLILVYRKIRIRDEWRQNRVAFLSIWGLSCLFGTTWSLAFLDFGPLSDVVLFLFCILNSFQGFLLMLRFYMLDWMRKHAGGSILGSTSTGSTRQHMLQAQEKS